MASASVKLKASEESLARKIDALIDRAADTMTDEEFARAREEAGELINDVRARALRRERA